MKKSKMIIIAAAGVLVLASMITVLIFIFKDNYKPDKETLSVVNEASVLLFNSEITGKYELKGTQQTDDKTKLYIFEFKLENGETATFAFAKDLKNTRKIYWKEDNAFKLVIFVSPDEQNLDNEASWPKGWK